MNKNRIKNHWAEKIQKAFGKLIVWFIIITSWMVAITCYVRRSAKHKKKTDFNPRGAETC